MRRALILLAALAGCASATGVVPAGDDTFWINRQGAGFWEGQGQLMAAVLKEAGAHCDAKNAQLQVIESDSSPAWPGHFPEAHAKFRCK